MADSQTDLLLKIKADVHDAVESLANLRGEFGGMSGAISALTSPTAMLTIGIGALVAGATSAVNAFLEDAKAARELAFQTGLTTKESHALSETVKILGGNSDSLHVAMMRLSLEVETGGKNLAKMGINIRDVNGHTKSLGELFLEARNRISEMSNSQERAAEMVKLFGRGSAELLPIMTRSKEEFQALYEKQKQSADAFDELATKRAEQYEQAMAEMKNRTHDLVVELGAALIPKINELLKTIPELWAELSHPIDTLKKIQDYFKNMDAGFTGFTAQVKIGAAEANNVMNALDATVKRTTDDMKKDAAGVKDVFVADAKAIHDEMTKVWIERAKASNAGYAADLATAKAWAEQQKNLLMQLYGFNERATFEQWAKRTQEGKQAAAQLASIDAALYAQEAALHQKAIKEYNTMEMEKWKAVFEMRKRQFTEEQDTLKHLMRTWQGYFSSIGHFMWDFTQNHKQALKNLESSIINWLIETLAKTAAQNVASTIMHESEGIAAANALAPETFGASLAWIPQIIASAESAISAIMGAIGLAEGGLVKARPGGVPAILGEGGVDELVVPLNKLGMAGGTTYNINVNLTAFGRMSKPDAEALSNQIGIGIMSRLRTLRPI